MRIYGINPVLEAIKARRAKEILVAQRALSEGETFKTFPAETAYPPIEIFEPLKNVREPFRVVGQFYALLPGTNAFYELEDVRGFDALHYSPTIKLWPLFCTFQSIWFNRVDDLTRPFLSALSCEIAIRKSPPLLYEL